VSRNHGENVIFILTKDEVLACANELGISKEQLTDDVIELVKMRLRSWSEVVKSALKEAIQCPLGLVCYPSCAWWKYGKCTFPRRINKSHRQKRVKDD